MSQTDDPRRPLSWRQTTSVWDVLTFCIAGMCIMSAAGFLPRMISVAGLIILVSFPAILLVALFWFQETLDRVTGA